MRRLLLLIFIFFLSGVYGSVNESTMNGVKFSLYDYDDAFDDADCRDNILVGFNHSGQALFYDEFDLSLTLWDPLQNTATQLPITKDIPLYCPPNSQCLSDQGTIVGIVDSSIAVWSEESGISFFPLPKELFQEEWKGFHLQYVEYLQNEKILLQFGATADRSKYYILENGVFLDLSAFLKAILHTSSDTIHDLHISRKGLITGILVPENKSQMENTRIFMWNGDSIYFNHIQNIVNRESHYPDELKILSILDNGDVMIYLDDYSSSDATCRCYRYVKWCPEKNKTDEILRKRKSFPSSFNSQGNGVFLDNHFYHVLYNGIVYSLGDVFEEHLLCHYDYWESSSPLIKINENNQLIVETMARCGNIPIMISISSVEN